MALHRDAPQVDGVLILVDTFAAGAVRAFNQLGVSIPEQMRIATAMTVSAPGKPGRG